ncbi:MAG: crotonase/enoyl-CoA hydratase family protein [Acidimicrobiia bacterium]|nr:crotonase/enoyl-CoA hydratase family protein [Acidimicrobiia bacterium]
MSVHYELRASTALITIDRPERRNAVNLETADLLQEAWHRFDADDKAAVGVLTGAQGVFSAGADLKDFDLVDRADGFLGFTRMIVSKPTIAAVEGYCLAGGLEMALWCDLRVAGDGAMFGCYERRFGVPLVDGGTQRLPRIVGMSRALDMILTGRSVDAAEAHHIGLADRLTPAGSALETALELASAIAAFPQATVRSDRLALLEGLGRPLAEGLAIERRHGLGVLDAATEGAAHFENGAGRGGAPLR